MITINKEKAREIKLRGIREERNRLLTDTDKYLLPDFPISPENLVLVKNYREELRDITETEDLDNLQFPTLSLL